MKIPKDYLYPGQQHILNVVRSMHKPVNQAAIARKAGVSYCHTNKTLHYLESRKFVKSRKQGRERLFEAVRK